MGGETPSMTVQIMTWAFGLVIVGLGSYGLVAGVLPGTIIFRKENFTGAAARLIGAALILFGVFTLVH